MPLLEWRQEYSVQLESVDAQHKKLLDMINQLHEAIMQNQANSVIHAVLEKMTVYTIQHFDYEEALLKKYNYPQLQEHLLEHEKYRAQVQQFQERYKNDSMVYAPKLLTSLVFWLRRHIQEKDMHYSQYLRSQGVRDV